MTKTETAILARLAASPVGATVVEWGLHRGRGHTGGLRPYGERERAAAASEIGGRIWDVELEAKPKKKRP